MSGGLTDHARALFEREALGVFFVDRIVRHKLGQQGHHGPDLASWTDPATGLLDFDRCPDHLLGPVQQMVENAQPLADELVLLAMADRMRRTGGPVVALTAQRVRVAITEEGPNPGHHRGTMARHRHEWPTLWAALDALMEATS